MIAAPEFYARRLGPPFVSHEKALDTRLPRPLRLAAARSGLVRGLALGWLARRGVGVAVIRRERGSLPALWVCALPPVRRSVFVLELIRRPLPPSRWRRWLYGIWWRLVETPALRRGASGAQVMTVWERDEYAAHYGLDRALVEHVPWAWSEGEEREPAPIRDSASEVFCSGRTACDWETLFAAATGSSWRLVVVCSQKDAPRVRVLAAAREAEVHVEIPWEVHDRLLRSAAVCVLAIEDRGLSAGHVRLMAAVEAGVPVVATDVRSLEGYAVAGETAVLVPAAAPRELRERVDGLLADPDGRRRIRDAALERARGWTYADYFERIRAVVFEALERYPDRRRSG